MGRNVSTDTNLSASVAVSNINNPVSGVFGTGKVKIFPTSATFTVPSGITSVRVRVWGAGGDSGSEYQSAGGGGGGFALKTINNLIPGSSITVTVGKGSCSFGSYVSATAGSTGANYYSGQYNLGGTGIGGDFNATGGSSARNGGGGGSASIFGNGGSSGGPSAIPGASGAGGSGSYSQAANGISGTGGSYLASNSGASSGMPTAGLMGSIDFIGTGGGGATNQCGINGGGGGANAHGGFPGGGGGGGGSGNGQGASGLVIVEW